jgi:hypothetical protein
MSHRLINYKDNKTKCHLYCNKVYRIYKQSVMLVFSTQFCELLPLPTSLWFNSPPPPFPKSK